MENKETFHNRLQPYLSPSQQLDVKLAYCLAKFGHRAQTRKELTEDNRPTRYFEHVRRVAIILMDEMNIHDRDMVIAALLHDSLEDTHDLSAELLEHCFGTDVITMIKVLSKIPKEGYAARLAAYPDWKALAIKMCDRLDNLRSLMIPGTTIEFQKKQIKETRDIYFPIFDRAISICPRDRLPNLMKIRDQIRDLITKYQTILEFKEHTI